MFGQLFHNFDTKRASSPRLGCDVSRNYWLALIFSHSVTAHMSLQVKGVSVTFITDITSIHFHGIVNNINVFRK